MDFTGGLETAYRLSDGNVRGPRRIGEPPDTLITHMTLYNPPSHLWEIHEGNTRTGTWGDMG